MNALDAARELQYYELCAWCPRLCRHVCPVGLASGHEAATPTAMMLAVYLYRRGRLSAERAAEAAALCTDCGACTDHCKYDVPVGELLARERGRLLPVPPAASLDPLQGEGEWVAVECDDRQWAEALSTRLGAPVARLRTGDHLGADRSEHREAFAGPAARLRAALGARRPVTSCGRCARALEAAGVSFARLSELLDLPLPQPRLPSPVFGDPGTTGPTWLLEMGTGGALARLHPHRAREMARHCADRLEGGRAGIVDSAGRAALRQAGAQVVDPVDILIEEA